MKLLNPTARHVQIGAIIDQCVGDKAKKVIAKRRIDMASGNISSYARVLNGPHQLEKIQTFNELAATMTTLKKERDQAREEASARKKQEDKDKAARKAEKERDAINKQNELGPICKAHVDKGLAHVLSLKVPQRREILRQTRQGSVSSRSYRWSKSKSNDFTL